MVGTLDLTGDGKRTRPDHIRALKSHAFQLGWDCLVPMSLLGIPTAQFCPLLRAWAQPRGGDRLPPRAGAGHADPRERPLRVLWTRLGHGRRREVVLGRNCKCHHGPRHDKLPMGWAFRPGCMGIANFFGRRGAPGFYWASVQLHGARLELRRFMATHQLHWLWWFFACLHWPGALAFVAPALIFFVADGARRLVSERTARRCAVVRHGPKITTVLVPCPGYTVRQLTAASFGCGASAFR